MALFLYDKEKSLNPAEKRNTHENHREVAKTQLHSNPGREVGAEKQTQRRN